LLDNNLKFAVIGTGVVGTALAVLLEKAGLECIGVNTRSRVSYERFSQYLKKEHLVLAQISEQADLIFITTQDSFLEEVAQELASFKIRKSGQTLIHCSGSLRAMSLCKDNSLDVGYLSLHPMQAFAGIDSTLDLIRGTHFGIEGNNQESEMLGDFLVKLLGGVPHRIDPARKTLYHAGAVVASNYLVSLAYLSVKLLEKAGIKREDALESLLPLMVGSFHNLEEKGFAEALTGPIARGDTKVVESHLREIPEQYRQAYKCLGLLALELVKEKKQLQQGSACDLQELIALKDLLS